MSYCNNPNIPAHDVGSNTCCFHCLAYARGRAEERAKVVAWLRAKDDKHFIGYRVGGGLISAESGLADAIVRGEHEPK